MYLQTRHGRHLDWPYNHFNDTLCDQRSHLHLLHFHTYTGLPVSDLWKSLSQTAARTLGSSTIPPPIRTALWRLFSQRPQQLLLFSTTTGEGDDGYTIERPVRTKKRGRNVLQDEKPKVFHTWNEGTTTTPTAAAAANLRLLAHPSLQDAAMGLYGSRCMRYAISHDQRQTLRLLAEARNAGALQTQLTAKLNVDPRNYSYVVKNLEERGLVTKCSAVVQKARAMSTTTNLVVLTKFAPQELLDPHRAFLECGIETRGEDGTAGVTGGGGGGGMEMTGRHKQSYRAVQTYDSDNDEEYEDDNEDEDNEAEEDGMRQQHQDNNNNGIGTATANHFLQDDEFHLQRITHHLSTVEHCTQNETDLKRSLGFVLTIGHRRWRRYRGILIKKGCIERYETGVEGEDEDSTYKVFMVRLLKQWPSVSDDEEGWIPSLLNPMTNRLDIYGEQLAEISIDRQILHVLAEEGGEGCTTQTFDAKLRLNMKRAESRLRELSVRFGAGGVTEKHVSVGRARMIAYCARGDVLALLDVALPGATLSASGSGGTDGTVIVPGGFVAAVEDAIRAGLDEDGRNPLLQVVGGGREEGDGGGGGVDERVEREENGEGARMAFYKTTTDRPDTNPNPDNTAKAVTKTNVRRHRIQTVEIHNLRHQWLVEKVRQEGMMLVSEMGAFFQQQERLLRNNPSACRPDSKVNRRIIDAAKRAGEVEEIDVTFPGTNSAMTARPHKVIVVPGTVQDAAFVDRVMKHQRELQKRLRASQYGVGDTILGTGTGTADATKEASSVGGTKHLTPEEEEQEEEGYEEQQGVGDETKKRAKKRKVVGLGGAVAAVRARAIAAENGQQQQKQQMHGDTIITPDTIATLPLPPSYPQQHSQSHASVGIGIGPSTQQQQQQQQQRPLGRRPIFYPSRGSGADNTFQRQIARGLLPSRMLRAKRLHECIWEVIKARGGQPTKYLDPSIVQAASEGNAYYVVNIPNCDDGSEDGETGETATATGQQNLNADTTNKNKNKVPPHNMNTRQNKYRGSAEEVGMVLTTDELWKEMRVSTLLACAGSKAEDQELVDRLSQENKKLRQLKRRELEALCGGGAALTVAKNQLMRLLDVLTRMGLVAPIVPFGQAAAKAALLAAYGPQGTTGTAAYIVLPSVQYEEPIDVRVVGVGMQGLAVPVEAEVDVEVTKKLLHQFDVRVLTERQSFWSSLEFFIVRFSCSPLAKKVPSPTHILQTLFPFDRTPECVRARGWLGMPLPNVELTERAMDALMTKVSTRPLHGGGGVGGRGGSGSGDDKSDQQQHPQLRLKRLEGIDWKQAEQVSNELRVSFEVVMKAYLLLFKNQKPEKKSLRGGGGGGERLGRLGARRGGGRGRGRGGGRGSSSRRRKRKGTDLERDSDDDDDDDGAYYDNESDGQETNEEDEAALYTLAGDEENEQDGDTKDAQANANAPPQRKRKWTKEEDRQLLVAWAQWLAAHGPDKILRWKFVKGKPPNVMVSSLKHRIQRLKDGAETGGDMLTILQVTGDVYRRRVLGEGRGEEKNSNTNANIGVGVCLWEGASEHDTDAHQSVVDAIEHIVSIAPNRYKEKKTTTTGAGVKRATTLHPPSSSRGGGRRAGGNTTTTQHRYTSNTRTYNPIIVSRQFTTLRAWADLAMEASRRLEKSRQHHNNHTGPCPGEAATMEGIKSLLLGLHSGQFYKITVLQNGTVASIALDPSLATALVRGGNGGQGVGGAETVSAALLELLRSGVVYFGERAIEKMGLCVKTPLCLSDRFFAELQPLFLSSSIFEGAATAMCGTFSPHSSPSSSRSAVVVVVKNSTDNNEDDKNVFGGTVAAALSLALCGGDGGGSDTGQVTLSSTLPRSVPLPVVKSAAAAAAAKQQQKQQQQQKQGEDDDVDIVEQQQPNGSGSDNTQDASIKMLDSIKVTATIKSITTTPNSTRPQGQGIEITDGHGVTHSLQFSSQQQVLYQPREVALHEDIRTAAVKTCTQAMSISCKGLGEAGAGAVVDAVLQALDRAGEDGLGVDQVWEVVTTIGKVEIEVVLQRMRRCGLLVSVCGYDDVRLLTAHHSRSRMVLLPPSSVKKHALPLGTPQSWLDIPTHAWVDHYGRLHKELWQSLVQRAVATVMKYPGVTGDVVLQSIRVVNVQEGRQLLKTLIGAGVLRVKKEEGGKSEGEKKKSVLERCFMGGGDEAVVTSGGGAGELYWNELSLSPSPLPSLVEDHTWHFFADPVMCWKALHVLPKQVLVDATTA